MSARMGAVTGKGLSDLIREEFGLRITFLMMLGILITNFGNVVTEFIGIATSLELFGLSRYVTVPVCGLIVWLIVVKGQYKSVEKVFLAASFFYITYIFAGALAHPAWKVATVATFKPPEWARFREQAYLYMVIGVVGTTIAPWMQFYLQSSIVEKGVTRRGLRASRWDVITGCIFTDVVAWFIIVACAATLYVHGYRDIKYAADAAQALKPLAGQYAYILFAVGLFNASLFAASILPLSTAYTVCEGLGFESGVDKKFGEAPVFYWLYTLLIVAGGAVLLIPGLPLVRIAVLSQVVNGVVLPFVLIFMLLVIRKHAFVQRRGLADYSRNDRSDGGVVLDITRRRLERCRSNSHHGGIEKSRVVSFFLGAAACPGAQPKGLGGEKPFPQLNSSSCDISPSFHTILARMWQS